MARKLTFALFFLVSMLFLLPGESCTEHAVHNNTEAPTPEPSTPNVDPPCTCTDVAPPPPPMTNEAPPPPQPPTTPEAPPPPPATNQAPPPPPSNAGDGTTEGSLRPQDCNPRCQYRCSKTKHRMHTCMFYCTKCCAKCLCVPPGTYGNKKVCPCYDNWKTKRGGPKCP